MSRFDLEPFAVGSGIDILTGMVTDELQKNPGVAFIVDNKPDASSQIAAEAAACTYRIAFGPRAGQKVLTLPGAMPRQTDFKQNLCADNKGFGLHAAVRCGADDRQALEQLCHYITRPALANERKTALQTLAAYRRAIG